MKIVWKIGILLLCPIISLQHINPFAPSYIAGVVEYYPETEVKDGKSPSDVNAENYVKFIEMASKYSVDILVFPESSLSIRTTRNGTGSRTEATSHIPEPGENVIVCDDYRDIIAQSLRTVSCAARQHRLYVAVNHLERLDCEQHHEHLGKDDCPADGFLVYNANVVFDRLGRLVAKYRKANLFGEPWANVTAQPQLSTFATDFGVTFGQFVCFDLLFESPALRLTGRLAAKSDVHDIVFSAHWYSELPFLYAATAQSGWAHANDANLLAAGHNNPWTGSSGSGIYIGRQGYVEVVSEKRIKNYLIVAEVPKVINGTRSLNIDLSKSAKYEFNSSEFHVPIGNPDRFVYKKDDLTPYTTKLIDVKASSTLQETVCNRGLCCDFQLKLKYEEDVEQGSSVYYRYRLAAFNGVRTFSGVRTGGITVCGLISCANDTLDSCSELIDANKTIVPATFESIRIELHKAKSQNIFFMPITLTKTMTPLNATEFSYESIDTFNHTMKLINPRSDLLTFAIFGRNFDLDGFEVSTASSSMSFVSLLMILTTISVNGFAYIFH